MRKFVTSVICAFLLAVVCGCASSPEVADIRVDARANPKLDLSGFKTYAWAAAAAAVRDPDHAWTPTGLNVGSEIAFLVDRELRERGRTSVVDSPDMLAMFAVGVDMKALNVKVDPEDGTETSEIAPMGGIMVVLADPASRQVIWVGRAGADIADNPSVDLVKRRLEYAITKMFKDFPR